MNKLTNKFIAMLICLTFIMLALTTSSAIDVQQQNSKSEETTDQTPTTETYTFYRHGPDGSVTPLEIDIDLEEGQDIEDAIDAKCRELLENDVEIRSIIDDLKNITIGAVVYIESSGKGFHFHTKLLEKLFLRFWQWKLLIPRIAPFFATPLVFCRYHEDPDARTYFKTISPSKWISMYLPPLINKILWRQERNVTINGTHSVTVNSFIGITTWPGRISFTPLNVRAKRFFGYGRFVLIRDF